MGTQDQIDLVTDPLDFNNQEDNIGAQVQPDPVLDPLVLSSTDGFHSGQVNGTLQLNWENQTLREYQSQQQKYSPLGIRQLTRTTSINCSSPCILWDSPSRNDSP